MFFTVSDDTRPDYEAFLQERSTLLHDCNLFLSDACQLAGNTYKAGEAGDLAVIALVHHVIENIDGVCHLVGKGSVLPCYPLLRSIFDALLGVMYILQADSNNRGLAYYYFQVRQEMKYFERFDPCTNCGLEVRRELKDDIAGAGALDHLNLDAVREKLKVLASDLGDPIFKSIAAIWEEKSPREWYSILGRDNNLRELAISLNFLSGYERYYRPWCRQVHGTGTLANLSTTEDAIEFRPIRHPESIEDVVATAGKLALVLAGKLIARNDRQNEHGASRYRELGERLDVVTKEEAPKWRGE